jgi:MOSC domain-containing protein YiiM
MRNREPGTRLEVFGNGSSSAEVSEGSTCHRPPSVVAVAASGRHDFRKEVRRAITLLKDYGVEGDAHGGASIQHLYDKRRDPDSPNLRQVHLVEEELILELNALGFCLAAGNLGENITTRHVHLAGLDAGAVLQLGPSARIQVTGLRTPCVKIERFQKDLRRAVTSKSHGLAIMKRAVMAVVLASGTVSAGDPIHIIEQTGGPWHALRPV